MSRRQNSEDYWDRLTVTVHRGYKRWFKQVALDKNSDVSKIHREALEMWIAANYHILSEGAKKELDNLRKANADNRWSELL